MFFLPLCLPTAKDKKHSFTFSSTSFSSTSSSSTSSSSSSREGQYRDGDIREEVLFYFLLSPPLSLSPSLSLSHTHTHTNSLSLSFSLSLTHTHTHRHTHTPQKPTTLFYSDDSQLSHLSNCYTLSILQYHQALFIPTAHLQHTGRALTYSSQNSQLVHEYDGILI